MLGSNIFALSLRKINEQTAQSRTKNDGVLGNEVAVRLAQPQDSVPIRKLLWTAFQKKMTTFATQESEFLATMASEDLVQERLLIATKDSSSLNVLGAAGFSVNNQGYATANLFKLCGRRGVVRGITSWFVFKLLNSSAKPNELYIAAISVAPEARGLGVGSVLMNAMEQIAKDEGKTQLRLHVIDENPDARRLYERLGFRVTESTTTGPLQYVLGFKKTHVMVKPLN